MSQALESAVSFRPPPSLVDELVRVLTDRIVHGRIPPGTRLIEEKLAEEFGVSRPPIRESLRVLASEGLVTINHRRGAKVRQISAREVQDIYECREALEGFAARQAAERMSSGEFSDLALTLAKMETANASGDIESYFAENIRFHDIVGEASGNQRLRQLLGALGSQVLMLRFTSLSLPGRSSRSAALHRQLLEAFERRDGDAAESLTRRIIQEASRALGQHVEQGSPEA